MINRFGSSVFSDDLRCPSGNANLMQTVFGQQTLKHSVSQSATVTCYATVMSFEDLLTAE